jgi:hypothetical protein
MARRLRQSQSEGAAAEFAAFISNKGGFFMQQLIQQLTYSSMHSAGHGTGVSNRRRRLALSHGVYSAPIFERVPELPSRRGPSAQAVVLTAILGLFGLVLTTLALYQWTLIQQLHDDTASVRRESADRAQSPLSDSNSRLGMASVTPGSAAEVEQRRELSSYATYLKPLVLMWRETQMRADRGGATSMPDALETMREIEVRVSAVFPPDSAADVHGRLLACMRQVIEGYESEIQGSVEGAVAIRPSDAREAFDSVAIELESLPADAQ